MPTNRLARSERGPCSRLTRDGLVARAADGADQVGPAELFTHLGDVDVDRSGAAGELQPPDLVEQALPGHDEAGVVEQEGEQVELLARQLDRGPGDRDRPPAALEHDVAARTTSTPRLGLRAAQHCADPRDELAR